MIKVKYGETLRRFNARVADDKLGFNIDGLNDKIFQLFNFPPNSELTLTYIDEDGDVVTLVDDEDLQDILRQDLDPLRISVRLNTEKLGRSSGTSSGNSTSVRTPLIQLPTIPNINSSVSDLLKSLPKSKSKKSRKSQKHSTDLASKASSTAREIADLSKALSMTRLSYLKQACPASGVPMDGVISGEPSQAMNAEELTVETAGQPKNYTGPVNASTLKPSQPDQNGIQCESLSKSPKPSSFLLNGKKEEVNKFGDSHLVGKALGVSYPSASTIGLEKRADKHPSKSQPGAEPVGVIGSSSDVLSDGFKSPSSYSTNWVVPQLKNTSRPQYSPSHIPVIRSHNHSDKTASIFHRGVCCDGCGVHPITGPRFKSKVKEDYDLCSICFAEMGNDTDYIRMDCPVTYHHPIAFKALHDPRDIFRECMIKSPKPDSRFTQDVNVLDGTIMAPSTQFTKVWRMRNNGNIVWPQGTQLVWIGGDRFSDAISVELQITSAGLAVDHDLDVAVDFTAPELPGRYISYWRLALPSGEKFGQRVWVLIQVDFSMDLPDKVSYVASQDLDLNFPPSSNIIADSETNMIVEDIIADFKISGPAMKLVEPVVDGNRNKGQESNSCISPSAAGSSISYPIDLSEAPPAVTSAAPTSVAEVQASSQDDIEMALLKELGEMGFKQVNLNKEVLRMNGYNLEQTIADLCGASEWDPMLEELEEMGFHNKEMNKELLKKNNGSIKRVVMDLIAGED